jgi:hypothetical protein
MRIGYAASGKIARAADVNKSAGVRAYLGGRRGAA